MLVLRVLTLAHQIEIIKLSATSVWKTRSICKLQVLDHIKYEYTESLN